jgi:hypothetical protein
MNRSCFSAIICGALALLTAGSSGSASFDGAGGIHHRFFRIDFTSRIENPEVNAIEIIPRS